MSTRSATIIRQTTYWGEQADTGEIMRFYRHCDGYPEGHGMELAQAVQNADRAQPRPEEWLASVLNWFMSQSPYSTCIEFEPKGFQHGDLEYLYVVEGIVEHRWGRTKSGKLPVTISVYGIGWDESYNDAEKREPIFSGTAYEYIERFGKEQ
jgi:hypothetical protein